MEFFDNFWDSILHIDKYLKPLIEAQPFWCYLILAFIIFAETAFIVTSFLPSDVILFTACSLMAVHKGCFNPFILIPLFYAAAVLGDSVNFAIGRFFRKEINKTGKVLFIKKDNLDKTNIIFEKSGGAAVICARFVPLLRCLVPFVTGVSKKDYSWFLHRNLIGVGLWVTLYCTLGVFFGTIDFVKNHFGLVAIAIAVLTLITATISLLLRKFILERKTNKKEKEVK
ncbi:MAG: VTT domain-containing protein [Acutalibacteraceae bacterium]